MRVALNEMLSEPFRAWLLDLIERSDAGSINAVALRSDVDQSQLSKVVRGKLRATEPVLVKIAPHIGLTPERLVLLATIDRAGGMPELPVHLPEAGRQPELPVAFTKRLEARRAEAEAEEREAREAFD